MLRVAAVANGVIYEGEQYSERRISVSPTLENPSAAWIEDRPPVGEGSTGKNVNWALSGGPIKAAYNTATVEPLVGP